MNTGCVLIVDDDPDIRETTRFILECTGYRVSTAANGIEALERLRGGAAPCVILLDLMMPVMDGWEFRAEQTRDPGLAAIPVVVITGAGKAATRAAPIGAAGLLEKPINLATLLSTVRLYCEPTACDPG